MSLSFPRFLAAIVALAVPCLGRELLVLKSGFTIEASSHQIDAGALTIQTQTGTVVFPAAELESVQAVPDAAPAAEVAKVKDPLQAAADEQGLPAEFIRCVAQAESGLRVDAVSPKGAKGLMQLMPQTAAELGVDLNDPAENARGGAKYLRQLLLAYNGDAALALAAYNAGPAAVAKYGGIPPYPETRRYVLRILKQLAAEQKHNQ